MAKICRRESSDCSQTNAEQTNIEESPHPPRKGFGYFWASRLKERVQPSPDWITEWTYNLSKK